ncbi:tRNA (adenosine(37)-N6)-threonylcarbamoyltransferase complex ATPase subunit type 1 TsaE [Denitratisoma oestradiolicum]|uniref:tRNA (adenosine(37)-N6)-threonylcarbamoyltransferase complex ATPase subunit type 1 TsaE n=1 Tax=Denitratisoma oestradiolicum TaxID=311182 RepID=UPI002F96E0E7
MTLELPDENATLNLGGALARVLVPGLLIRLDGDLGAGKTTLVRGMLQSLGYKGRVKSPTYTLVEVHAVSGLNLYHFDFYRFNQAEEFLDAGLDEYFAGTGVCLVEWPDKAGHYLPAADLRIGLEVVGEGRHAFISAISERGRSCLTDLMNSLPGGWAVGMSSSLPPPA